MNCIIRRIGEDLWNGTSTCYTNAGTSRTLWVMILYTYFPRINSLSLKISFHIPQTENFKLLGKDLVRLVVLSSNVFSRR